MNAYHCESHRPVIAGNMNEAAEIFASRKARFAFGRSARVGAFRADCQSQDGTVGEYEVFIGRSTGLHETTGRNVRFTVRWVR